MVYKKFIKRNGKLYGPYYYKNVRADGRIKNVCLGRIPPKGERIEEKLTKQKLKIQERVSKRENVKKVNVIKSKKTGLISQKIGVTKNTFIFEKKPSEPVEKRGGVVDFYYDNQFKITIVFSVLMMMFFTTFQPLPTGFATYDSFIIKSVNESFDGCGFISLDDAYIEGNLTSFRISGTFEGENYAYVYLNDYLVFNSSRYDSETKSPLITGFLISFDNNTGYIINDSFEEGMLSDGANPNASIPGLPSNYSLNITPNVSVNNTLNISNSTFVENMLSNSTNLSDINSTVNMPYNFTDSLLDDTAPDCSVNPNSSASGALPITKFDFEFVCEETCVLEGVSFENLTLIVDLVNSTINITDVAYTVVDEKEVEFNLVLNKEKYFVGDTLNFTILPKDADYAIIISKGLESWPLKQPYFEINESGNYTVNALLNYDSGGVRITGNFEVYGNNLNFTIANQTLNISLV